MKIIVDTNIVFSAILNSNSRIGKILLNSKEHFQFYSCDYLRTEIQRHRSKLLKLTKLTESKLAELEGLVTHNITFIDERLLPRELLLKTEILLKSVDPNDTPFVALTKHLEGRLWTGDMQLYNGLKSKRFKEIILTAELSLLLDELERD
ncbi:MAG TPA: PIN domain-containing protein [Hanamia sp.]|nr:PIN domain-containing protein [Hanamia sp.]